MPGPLQALVAAYDKRMELTLSLPHLGLAGCLRHSFPKEKISSSDIGELNSRTKDPHFVCLEVADDDGVLNIVPLKGPCSWPIAAAFAREMILAGAHPFDVLLASADVTPLGKGGDGDPTWKFTTSVDQMFWTHEDQKRLETDASK